LPSFFPNENRKPKDQQVIVRQTNLVATGNLRRNSHITEWCELSTSGLLEPKQQPRAK